MIITLCGSARFEPQFKEWNKKLGLLGHVPFSLCCYPSDEGSKNWYSPEQKDMLDLVHLKKIDVSDAILVLNVDNYIGDSTRREISWARMAKKQIIWLEFSPVNMRGFDSTVHNQGWMKNA